MPVYKDARRNTWYVKFKYKNWKNEVKWVTKRGFPTKREALVWEREYQLRQNGSLDMTFTDFVGLYRQDRRPRIKESTFVTKDAIIDTKLIPYFGQRKLRDISAWDVLQWQNELLSYRNTDSEKIKQIYLDFLDDAKQICYTY